MYLWKLGSQLLCTNIKTFYFSLYESRKTGHTGVHYSSYESFTQSMVSRWGLLGKGEVAETGHNPLFWPRSLARHLRMSRVWLIAEDMSLRSKQVIHGHAPGSFITLHRHTKKSCSWCDHKGLWSHHEQDFSLAVVCSLFTCSAVNKKHIFLDVWNLVRMLWCQFVPWHEPNRCY